MKNLIIIILSLAFIPTINAQDIESELYGLFASMEKGFKDEMKNPTLDDELKCNIFNTQLALGSMNVLDSRIYQWDNGTTLYVHGIGEDKDEVIEKLEAFPVSRRYKVEILEKTSDSYHYVVKNNIGKGIGFLKIYKVSDEWGLNANLPFDKYKFKNDIQSILESAKSNFNTMGKTYWLDRDGNTAKMYKLTKKVNYVEEPFISISNNNQLSTVGLIYKFTDFEALKYQINEMNLSLSGYEKSTAKSNDKEFKYLFESKENKINLEISQEVNHLTPSITISYKKIKKKPPVESSKEEEDWSFLDDNESARMKDIRKEIVSIINDDTVKEFMDEFLKKTTIEGRKQKLSELRPYLSKQFGRMNQIMDWLVELQEEANQKKCPEAHERFGVGFFSAQQARDCLNNSMYSMGLCKKSTNDSHHNYYAKGVFEHYASFSKALIPLTQVINDFHKIYENCNSTTTTTSSSSSSNTTTSPKDYWRKEDIITIDRTGKTDLVGVGIYLDSYDSEWTGVNTRNTISGWAAYKAGIRETNSIIEVDGKSFKKIKRVSDFQNLLVGKTGTTVNIKYKKNGKIYEYILTRGEGGKAEEVIRKEEGVGFSIHRSVSLTGEILVSQTTSNWAASQAGIQQNTVILEIDDVKITKDNRYKVKSMLEGQSGTTVKVKFAEKDATTAKIYQLERGEKGKATFIKNVAIIQAEKPKPKPTTITENKDKIVGIGASYYQGKDADICEIMWISKSSSAYKAGIREGDFIMKVNDTNAKGKTESDLKKIIDGKKGTSVRITVDRDGKTQEFTVTR